MAFYLILTHMKIKGVKYRFRQKVLFCEQTYKLLKIWGKSAESAIFSLGGSENALAFSLPPIFAKKRSRAKKIDSNVKFNALSKIANRSALRLILSEL